MFINTQDNYHHVQGMNTLMLEKQIRDWWFLSAALLFPARRRRFFQPDDGHPRLCLCQCFEQPADHAPARIGYFQSGQPVHAAGLFEPFARHAKRMDTRGSFWQQHSRSGIGRKCSRQFQLGQIQIQQDVNLRSRKFLSPCFSQKRDSSRKASANFNRKIPLSLCARPTPA